MAFSDDDFIALKTWTRYVESRQREVSDATNKLQMQKDRLAASEVELRRVVDRLTCEMALLLPEEPAVSPPADAPRVIRMPKDED